MHLPVRATATLARAALVAVMVGVPVVLAVVAGRPLPRSVPTSGAGIGAALRRPLPDAFVPDAIVVVLWAVWADFTLAVVAEALARQTLYSPR